MKYNKLKLKELINLDINSNEVIAKKTGTSINMVGRISRGESIPSIDSLPKFAVYYKKDINYFFDIDTNTPPIAASPIEIYGPPKDLETIYKIMYEQQKEIADTVKEKTDWMKKFYESEKEVNRLKNTYAHGNGAKTG